MVLKFLYRGIYSNPMYYYKEYHNTFYLEFPWYYMWTYNLTRRAPNK